MELLASGDTITLVVLAVILLAGLFLLRVTFKLTATLFRVGCGLVFLIVVAAAIFLYTT